MDKKPTYGELENRVKELEQKLDKLRIAGKDPLASTIYLSLIDNAPIGMYTINTKGEFTYGNKKLLEMTGYKKEDWRNRPFHPIVHPEDLEIVLEKIRKRISGREITEPYEIRIFNASRESMWVRITAESLYETDERGEEKLTGIQAFVEDITDRKSAEIAMRESENRFKELANALPQIIFETDERGNITFVNRIAFDLFGYNKRDFAGSLNALEMLIPEDRERAMSNIQKVLKEVELAGNEYTALKKDGSTFPIEIHSTRIMNDGKATGLRGIIINMTERKRAEEALRASENLNRTLIEAASHSGQAIVLNQHRDGIEVACVFANSAATTILGYTEEELAQMSWLDILHPRYREIAKQRSQQRLQGKEIPDLFELTVVRKDGKEVPIEVSSAKTEFQGRDALATFFRDITERKRAEEELRKSEAEYKDLFDNADELIQIVSLDGRILKVNRKCLSILGYDEGELQGLSIRDIIHPDSIAHCKEVFQKVPTGENEHNMEATFVCKDGKTVQVEGGITCQFNGSIPVYVRCILRDVTERKSLEEEKRRLEDHIFQIKRIKALGTLAAGIAHNFNNLLMGIQGNVSLMQMGTDSNQPNYERLNCIEKQVFSGAKLTSQLLGYAREGRYLVRPISLNQLVEETATAFAATRKEIRVHLDLDENLLGLKADQGQIEQVLLNLYVNAAEAMPNGGDLFLKTSNVASQEMKGKAYNPRPGNYVLLTVTDTGVGMDKKVMERIFDPFFTTKGFAIGMGLGLSLAYGIIKGHSGYIDVESEEGKGSTFRIYLPASKDVIPRDTMSRTEIKIGKETILLVDDEEIVLNVGMDLLKALGYNVIKAESGAEAIDIFEKNRDRIDMVVLDMILPDMNGGKVYDRMRAINPGVRVLLSSGYGIDGQAKEILDRGCDGFIQKPYNLKEFSKKLRDILDKGRTKTLL